MSTLFPLSFVSNPSFLVKTLSFYWLIIQQNILFLLTKHFCYLNRFPSYRDIFACSAPQIIPLLGKTLLFISVLRHFPVPLVLPSST
jgi:hypothetical protein